MPPANCGHYNEWLIYALDQQGKDSRPRIENCRAEALAMLASGRDRSALGSGRSSFNNWATIALRHGVDTGRWPDWSGVPAGNGVALGRFNLAYGRLLAARGNARGCVLRPHGIEAAEGRHRRRHAGRAARRPRVRRLAGSRRGTGRSHHRAGRRAAGRGPAVASRGRRGGGLTADTSSVRRSWRNRAGNCWATNIWRMGASLRRPTPIAGHGGGPGPAPFGGRAQGRKPLIAAPRHG